MLHLKLGAFCAFSPLVNAGYTNKQVKGEVDK